MLQVGCICGLMTYVIIHSIIIQLLYVSGKRTFGRMTHVIFHSIIIQLLYVTGKRTFGRMTHVICHSIIMQLLYVTSVLYLLYDDSCCRSL